MTYPGFIPAIRRLFTIHCPKPPFVMDFKAPSITTFKTELDEVLHNHRVRFVIMDKNEDRTFYKGIFQQDTLYILVPEMQEYSGFTTAREKSALYTDFKILQRHIKRLHPKAQFLTQSF